MIRVILASSIDEPVDSPTSFLLTSQVVVVFFKLVLPNVFHENELYTHAYRTLSCYNWKNEKYTSVVLASFSKQNDLRRYRTHAYRTLSGHNWKNEKYTSVVLASFSKQNDLRRCRTGRWRNDAFWR